MTMNYKEMAKGELCRYGALQKSLMTLPEQIARMEATLTGTGTGMSDRTPVRGSGISRAEEWLVNGLDRKIRLERNLEEARTTVETVSTALEALNREERLVLERFYIARSRDYKDRLCQELGCEESTLYRLKNRALGRFAVAMYGAQ